MPSKSSVTVIIPALNEGEVIGDLVRKLKSYAYVCEVLVVDDGSIDETGKEAATAGAVVCRHPYTMGNGAAIKTGIRNAKSTWIAMMDADGQHRPEDLECLLESAGDYKMVVGARDRSGQSNWWRAAANRVYNLLATYVTGMSVKDLTSGYRCIERAVALKFLYLLPNTFSYPTTLTLALLRSGYPVAFVPIQVRRREGKSKIKLWKDGSRFFIIIMKICMLFSPLRVFLPASAALFGIGCGYYAYTFFTAHRFTNMTALLLTSSILVFLLGLIAEQISQLRMDRTED